MEVSNPKVGLQLEALWSDFGRVLIHSHIPPTWFENVFHFIKHMSRFNLFFIQSFFWAYPSFRVVGKEAFDVISSSSIKCHLVQCYVGLFFTQIYPLHMCRVYFFKLIYLKKKITFFHMQKTSLVTYI